MSELDKIYDKVVKIDSDVGDLKIAVADNTNDLKHHIKRTDDLQAIVEGLHQIVTPLHEDYVSKRAIEAYKKEQREEISHKMKLPSLVYYTLAALATIGAAVAWLLGHK